MTHHLARLRLANIGQASARFNDLTLDFTDGTTPVDSVLWLKNGGGKSTVLSLFLSLLLPRKYDFMSRTAKRDLVDYIQSGDTAHVIAEWHPTRSTNLLGEPDFVLVVGVVYEWPGRTRPEKYSRNELQTTWYTYYTTPSVPAVRDLLIEGRRTQFVDRLRTMQANNPGMELILAADSQEQWARAMRQRGIDTDLFLRQKQMNEVEGGAAQLFTVNTVDQFINLLLDLTVPDDKAAQVSDNLSAVADKVAKKGPYLAERRFCDTTIPLLDRLAEAAAAVETANAEAADAETGAQRLAGSLAAAEERLERQSTAYAAEADEAEERRRNADIAADRALATVNAYELEAARFDEDSAREAFIAAEQAVTQAELEQAGWAAAIELANLRAREAEHRRCKAAREASDRESAPQRESHDHAASVYWVRLGEEATNARAEAAVHSEAAEEARAAASEARARATAAQQRQIEAVKRSASAGQVITTHEANVRGAVVAGVLDSTNADPAIALDAANRRDGQLDTAIEDATTRIGEADTRLHELAKADLELGLEISSLGRDLGEENTARDRLHARLGALAADPLLQLVVQAAPGESVDVWGEADRLGSALTTQALTAHRTRIEAEAEDTEDARLADAVERTGYLPTTLDAERVAQLLADRGLTAQPGWEYLRRVHAAAAATAESGSALHRVGAGVVVAAEHADTAAAILATGAEPTLSLVGVYTNTAADAAAADPALVQLAPVWEQPEPGVLDLAGARTRAEQVQHRRDRRQERVTEASAAETAANTLLDTLTRFLSDCPAGHLEGIDARIDSLQSALREASEAQEQVARDQAMEKQERSAAEAARKGAEKQRRALAAAIEKLRQLTSSQPEYAAAKQQRQDADAEARRAAQETAVAARQASDHDERRQVEENAAGDRERNAKGYEKDRRSIEFIDGEHTLAVAPAMTVEEARAAYDAAHEQWRIHVGQDVTAAREQSAAKEVIQAQRQVDRFPAHVIERAGALLTTPDGQGDDLRHAAQSRAQDVAGLAAQRRGEASAHLTRCEEATQAKHAAITTARRAVPTLTPPPTSREECDTQIDVLNAEHEQHLEMARTATTERDEARGSIDRVDATRGTFKSHRSHLPAPGPGLAADPFAGDGGDAEHAATAANDRRQSTREHAAAAASALQSAMSDTRKAATSSPVSLHVRDRILSEPDHIVAASAPDWANQMRIRISHIDGELASIADDQRIVSTVLAGLVRDALRTMKNAERHSKISGTGGPWEGKQFLRIRFDDPDDATLRTLMVRVIDEQVTKNTKPEGMPLLQAAVKAAVAPGGFKVSILKPTGDGTAERADVTLLSQWSGGEALTVAIALYCTLAKVSAANRGTPGADGGTLILDNPIGKANSPALLSLQHAIANSSGVQLIYTTGVNDLGALAQFGSIIRLDNRAAISGHRRYVILDNDHQGIQAARVARTAS